MKKESASLKPTATENFTPKRKPPKLRAWEKDYPDYKLWDSHRWAWEFLRRNSEFIAECGSIKNRNILKQKEAIAAKYGLSFFKHYSENEKPYPKFINRTIQSWQPEENQESKVTIDLRNGQMLILFNVDQTLKTSFELRAQIKSATEALEQYREELVILSSNTKNEQPQKRRSSSPMHYLRHLKVIDAREKKIPWAKIAKLVFAEKIKIDEKIKGHALTNIEITQKYYKTLLASLEKPNDYRLIAINTIKTSQFERFMENRTHKKKLDAKLGRIKILKASKAITQETLETTG